MAATQIKTTGIADGAITAAKIASGAVSAVTVASSNPAVGSEGSLLYNTTTDVLYVSNGSAWLTVANSVPVTTGGTVTINSLAAGGTFNYNLGLNFADDSSNDGQLAYTLHAGTLPGGCTLPSFGNSAFTGTATDPATDTTFNFTIRGTDSSGAFGIQAYQQTVTNSPPTATGGTVTITAALTGSTFNYNLGLNFTDATSTDAQLAYTLQSGSLPGGCTLPSSGNSAFTGTSNAAGTFNFVIRATDASNRFVDQTYTQVVTVAFAATGGAITTVGSYKVHTFTSSGTFTPNQAASNIDIMWVAGGAGGGGGRHGGGGGAGGMRTLTGQTVAATGYTVTIGAGGSRGHSGSSTYTGTNGSNTSINFPTSLTNLGGGGGGSWSSANSDGGSGGSGGGLGYGGTIGYGTSGQGNNGGTYGTQSPYYGSGGGGGKGAVGTNGTSNAGGGAGGVGGTNNYRTGSNVYYAGGGGGGSWSNGTPGAGGAGGGGAGNITNSQAIAGIVNTGGGGGGTAGNTNNGSGGNGGSGILIIRYPS